MTTLNMNGVRQIYRVTPIFEKRTVSKRSYTKKERRRVIRDCLHMTTKEKRAYSKRKGYNFETISYFLYQYKIGNQ